MTACERAPVPRPTAAPVTPDKAQLRAEPPDAKFESPTTWHAAKHSWLTAKSEKPTVEPPDLADESWRALVNQHDPMQIKNPQWQPLEPDKNVELQMPEGSRFQCRVLPLSVKFVTNDFNTELKAWQLTRLLVCSDDGWQNWTEYEHVAKLFPNGQREMGLVPEAKLRERQPDGTIRHTFVLLRSDKHRRQATTGAPQVVPGRQVDDD